MGAPDAAPGAGPTRPRGAGARPARRAVAPRAAAAASLVAPGLGQALAGDVRRGAAVAGAAAAAVVVLTWLGQPVLWTTAVPLAALAAADAADVARGARPRTAWLALAAVLPLYAAGWQATGIDLGRLATGFPKVRPLFGALVAPDFVDRERATVSAFVGVRTPCPDPVPAPVPPPASGPSVRVTPACAALGEVLAVAGTGYPAGRTVGLTWINPSGNRTAVGTATTDAAGGFTAAITIPVASVPEIYRSRVQSQRLEAAVAGPPGRLVPSPTLRLILDNMGVTIALGLMATLLGALLAIPLAVLGARNLTRGSPAARAAYVAVRAAMNVLRSIEPLIVAVVFVVWVKQGPFAGVLALTLHSVAALGKLYSEQIEAIDPGPIDAIRATGANGLQTVVYAVLPQVVPPFAAFTVYRWDINVRMSTIIGFVGGGGIGFLLQQWIQRARWSEAATAVVVIAVVVVILDVFSAAVRARIDAGRALVPARWRPVAALAVIALVAWAWRVSDIRPARLVEGAPKIRGIVGELARPDLVARGVVTTTARASLVVPCDLPPQPPAIDAGARAGPRLAVGAGCADAGDTVTVMAEGWPAGARVALRWRLPDGGRLAAARDVAGADGSLMVRVDVRPLVAEAGRAAGVPTVIEAEASQPVGGVRPSARVTTTVDQLIQTILMALMATTLGALLALPFGLLGARNLMPRTWAGNAAYAATRALLNGLRAIEPIILAAIFASWVGYGVPFGGVLALVVVTVANLGKLFSEAVENVDSGPLEAIEATGAGRLQTIVYGVVPQVVPPFLAFGIYHWDINVRISTVIGFVGGGGIGFVLREWMNQLQWGWASVAVIGIVVVVASMDALSVRLRERLV